MEFLFQVSGYWYRPDTWQHTVCIKQLLSFCNDSGRRLSQFNLGKAVLLVNCPETKHFFILNLKISDD